MSTPTPALALAADLAAGLGQVEHVQGSLTVTIAGHVLTADSARDLRQVLSGHLYNHWHTRLGQDEDTTTRFYRDLPFERRLAAHTPVHTTQRAATLLPDRAVEDDEHPDRVVLVLLDGVRVGMPRASILEQREQAVLLTAPAARPSLSPGFWLVDGSRGRFLSGRAPLRVYLSIPEMDSAPRVWQTALQALEAGGHRYRAKVGSSARLYPRTDACVVYLDGSSPTTDEPDGPVGALLGALRDSPGLGDTTSVFTRTLAPGIAVASEPVDPRPGMAGMSFGQHRCHAVATGIIDTTAGVDLAARVRAALLAAAVDPGDPARNTSLPAAAGRDSLGLDGGGA